MRVIGILICLICCFAGNFGVAAQSVSHSYNQGLTGNGAYSTRFSDLFSFLNNSASLAPVKSAGAAVYAENRYGLKELNKYVLTGICGMNGIGGMGMVIAYEGDGDYNHSQIGIAYGKSLGRVAIGVRSSYNMVQMAGYGNVGAISVELGSIWKITEKFFSGIQVFNPRGEKLPSQYSIGAGYEISEQLFMYANIIKEENKVMNVQAGLQYVVVKALYASLGINSATASPCILVGWQWKTMRICLAGSMHPQLGATTGLSIQFFGKNKKDDL
jgi:hypothetical protein